MTADEVKKLLGLVPHPQEGGWYRRTYESAANLRDRPAATAIYYLLEPGAFSEMHRLHSDELFHFYAGDPVEQLQLLPGGGASLLTLGSDLARGQQPQVTVPAGTWQGARLVEGGAWALLGCTVTPGFLFEEYESGTRAELMGEWREWAELIGELCRR